MQVDILTAIFDPEIKQHVFAGLPTGWGKSLPQLLVSPLSPPGKISISKQIKLI